MPEGDRGLADGHLGAGDQVLGTGLLCRAAAFSPMPGRGVGAVEHQVLIGLRRPRPDARVEEVPDLVVELHPEPAVHVALLDPVAPDPLHEGVPPLEPETARERELGVAKRHRGAARRGRRSGQRRGMVPGDQVEIAGTPRCTPRRRSLARVRSWRRSGLRRQGDGARPRSCGRGPRRGPPGRGHGRARRGCRAQCPPAVIPRPLAGTARGFVGRRRQPSRCTRCLPRTGGALVRAGGMLPQEAPKRPGWDGDHGPRGVTRPTAGHDRHMSENANGTAASTRPLYPEPTARRRGVAVSHRRLRRPRAAPSSASSPALGYDVAVLARESDGLHAAAREVEPRPASAARRSRRRRRRRRGRGGGRAGRARARADRRLGQRRDGHRLRAVSSTIEPGRVPPRHPGHLPRLRQRDAGRAAPDGAARPRHDRAGRLGARVPRHPAADRLLRRQARHQGFTESLQAELMHDGSGVHVRWSTCRRSTRRSSAGSGRRLPKHPQPVPPIFQPEVGARAVAWSAAPPGAASLRRAGRPRWPSSATRWRPGSLDWYLAHTGYAGQQTDEQRPSYGRTTSTSRSTDDIGAHGSFDHRAKPPAPRPG